MPGPAPDPNARHRQGGKSKNGVVTLPAAGYDGATPEWPMSTLPAGATMDLWRSLWRKPQAVMWARDGSERVVARYALVTVLSEDPENPNASLLSEVRQMEDRLGLSPMAMKRLMWEIGEPKDERQLAEVTTLDRFKDL